MNSIVCEGVDLSMLRGGNDGEMTMAEGSLRVFVSGFGVRICFDGGDE